MRPSWIVSSSDGEAACGWLAPVSAGAAGAVSDDGVPPPFAAATMPLISNPSLPIIHSSSFTAIFSPAFAPWYNRVPSL